MSSSKLCDETSTRRCRTCGLVKTEGEYYGRELGRRFDPVCKPCRKAERRQRYRRQAGGEAETVGTPARELAAADVPLANAAPVTSTRTLSRADFDNALELFRLLKTWRDEGKGLNSMSMSEIA